MIELCHAVHGDTVASWNKGIPSPSAYWARSLSSCRNEELQKNDFASCLPFASPSGTARPDTTCKYRLFKALENRVHLKNEIWQKILPVSIFEKATPQKINIFCVHFSWQVHWLDAFFWKTGKLHETNYRKADKKIKILVVKTDKTAYNRLRNRGEVPHDREKSGAKAGTFSAGG